ncbi:MAG: hypothetical protein AB2L14_29555 [Candidatus Xenobiia bacterium LiM19]
MFRGHMRILIIVILLCWFLTLSCDAGYEPPSDQFLILIDVEGGVSAPLSDYARVPIFCLYKNGDLIYSFFDSKENHVTVKQAHLDQAGIDSLMNFFKEKGAEEWNEYYEDCPIKEMPTTRFLLNMPRGIKKVYVRGIDYGVKTKTLPEGLVQAYRKILVFSADDAVDYESPQIILYVKKIENEPRGGSVKIYRWGPKIELEALSQEAGLSGYASVILEGKRARSVQNELWNKCLFSMPGTSSFFKQGKSFFSCAYRPLLLHEVTKKDDKKGKKKENK